VLVVQPDTKHGSWQNRRNGAFYLDGLFVSQKSSILVSLFSCNRMHKLSCFRQKTSRILRPDFISHAFPVFFANTEAPSRKLVNINRNHVSIARCCDLH
jgi:hypothetical protein